MSAFVCDDKTINRIIAGLSFAMTSGGYPTQFEKPSAELAEMLNDPAEFGRVLYSMNVNAVEQRYPDCVGNANNLPGQCDDNGNHVPFRFAHIMPTTVIQFYKSINCYLYQCSEGDVDELPLYKMLREYSKNLAVAIVERMPAYDKAEWG